MSDSLLRIEGLKVSVEGKEILKGVNLEIREGQIHAVMGPNGSGKSTLAYALMGHPKYEVAAGKVEYLGGNLLEMSPDERARKGLFLAFQYPIAVPGVSVANFMRTMLKSFRGEDVPVKEFRQEVRRQLEALGIPEQFMNRYLNDGFSGGEKKRCEILQMALARPRMAILDETDSGLDIDALQTVAAGVNKLFHGEMGMLLITHYQRILNYIAPHVVHIFYDGRIVKTGGPDLAHRLEKEGYGRILEEVTGRPVSLADQAEESVQKEPVRA